MYYCIGQDMAQSEADEILMYLEDKGYMLYDFFIRQGYQNHNFKVDGVFHKKMVRDSLHVRFSVYGKTPSIDALAEDLHCYMVNGFEKKMKLNLSNGKQIMMVCSNGSSAYTEAKII